MWSTVASPTAVTKLSSPAAAAAATTAAAGCHLVVDFRADFLCDLTADRSTAWAASPPP